MPLLSTLVDNFNDNTIGPEWGNAYGGVSEVGGRARIPAVAGQYAGYQTPKDWTLAGSSVYLQIPTVPSGVGATTEAQAVFSVICNTAGSNLACNINTKAGTIRFENNVGYFDSGAVSLTYSATTHKWLRIRETGGQVFFDSSTDGSTWTNRRTITTPAWATVVNGIALDLWAFRDAGASDVAEFDNVNTLANGAVHQLGATLSAASGLTASAVRTAALEAMLSADTGLEANANATVSMSATLSAESDLTAVPEADASVDPNVRVRPPTSRWRISEPWL